MLNDLPDAACVIAAGAASVALPTHAAVRRGLSGTLLIAFAIASLRITGGAEMIGSGLSVGSFAITCGIALLGLLVLLVQVVGALRRGGWGRLAQGWVVFATVMALSLGARPLVSLVQTGGGLVALATAAGLLLLGALLFFAGSRIPIGPAVVRIDRMVLVRHVPATGRVTWKRTGTVAVWVHLACGVGLLLAQQLNLFMLLLIVALASGVLVERLLGRLRRLPVTVYLAILALGAAWHLLAHVAGALPVPLAALSDAPYSTAFQLAAALALGLVAWSLLRLWPFHGPPRGPLAPLLGGVLFVRLIAPALPDGLMHWQPVWYLLAAIAGGHALATRRDEEALSALAALGLVSGVPAAASAGLGFVAAAIVTRLVRLLKENGWVLNPRGRVVVALLVVAGSALLIPVLDGALSTQVLYTTVTVGLLSMLLWRFNAATAAQA